MSLRTEFLVPESPRWTETLATVRHDVYHLPAYAHLEAQREGGESLAFLAEESGRRLFVPVIVRPISSDPSGILFDATCPYGYPGPLFDLGSAGEGADFRDRSVEALLRALHSRGVIAVFLRLHPILTTEHEPFSRHGCLATPGETVSIPLSRPLEDLWQGMRKDHRRDIRRAEEKGYEVRIDNDWQCFDAFLDVYLQTMHRVGAGASYHFTRDYFQELRKALRGRLFLGVVERAGRVACAGLFTESCGIVQFHLSGTDSDFLADHPSKLLLNFISRWARDRGDQVFHLGGGVSGKNDSLFQFKSGFSATRHPALTWRAIINQPAYRALTERWESRAGINADGIDGYFPAYRRKIVSSRLAKAGP